MLVIFLIDNKHSFARSRPTPPLWRGTGNDLRHRLIVIRQHDFLTRTQRPHQFDQFRRGLLDGNGLSHRHSPEYSIWLYRKHDVGIESIPTPCLIPSAKVTL